jgi:hypothetical protein
LKVLGNKGDKQEAKHSSKGMANFWTKIWSLLFHDDVYYRIGGYLIVGLVLFFVSWALFAFGVKKTGMLMDSFLVQKLFKQDVLRTIGPWGAKTFGETWKIFAWKIDVSKTFGVWGNVFLLTFKYFLNHLVFVIIFICGFNFFRLGRWNVGLIYFLLYTILWGAVVGTSSMLFPAGSNLVLGPLVLFARYGLWTWFSYLLLVTSTTQFTWLAAPNWLSGEWEKKRKIWPLSFTPDQGEVFIYGLLFLLASSFAEARIFVHYNLF